MWLRGVVRIRWKLIVDVLTRLRCAAQFVKPSSGVGGLFHESNDKVHGQVK